ncbi:hypothetical protein ACH3VR_18610 [Microbacterium sp. B2969]|uniref:Lipoprotein n=1 Tax=Microbacterium alkaliflavum TaxID=3248839 RepID=A0ABW7QBW8_9MICO
MKSRLVAAAAVLAIAGLMTSGCSAQPDPERTPSAAFSSEEEAFAAAEATYRAYVDALNQVDLSDPETFEDVYAWTTGDANAGARKSFTQMHADGWTVLGESTFDNFMGEEFNPTSPEDAVTAVVCLDVTDVDVQDASGVSVVPDTRNDRQPATLAFAIGDSSTGLLIAGSTATEDPTCGQ